MMEYDEIDNFVDQLFNKPEGGDNDKGEVPSGDWRIDRIDQIIQDTYDEAIWWHNQRISEGTDPRSGLRNLPYIPPESPNVYAGMSLERNGYSQTHAAAAGQAWDTRGLGVAGVLLIIALCIVTCAGMMLFDGTISLVR